MIGTYVQARINNEQIFFRKNLCDLQDSHVNTARQFDIIIPS